MPQMIFLAWVVPDGRRRGSLGIEMSVFKGGQKRGEKASDNGGEPESGLPEAGLQ